MTVIINLGANELEYDLSLRLDKEIIISNYETPCDKLRPYEAIVIRG